MREKVEWWRLQKKVNQVWLPVIYLRACLMPNESVMDVFEQFYKWPDDNDSCTRAHYRPNILLNMQLRHGAPVEQQITANYASILNF